MQPGARARTARPAKSVCTSYIPPTLPQSLLQYNFSKLSRRKSSPLFSPRLCLSRSLSNTINNQYGQVWFLSFQRTPLKSEAISSEIRGGVN